MSEQLTHVEAPEEIGNDARYDQFETVEIPELKSPEDLQQTVQEFVRGERDVVFIPSTVKLGGEASSGESIDVATRDDAVQAALEQALGYELDWAYDTPLGGMRPGGIDDAGWHTDSMPSSEEEVHYHVHTTLHGGGKVKVADVGPGLAESYQRNAASIPGLSEALARGETNPELMGTTVQEHTINPGDTLLFRTSGENPVWHNFETDQRGRESHLRALKPTTSPVAPQPDSSGGLL